MSAQWPSAVVTTSQLYVAVNELQTNLSAGINAAVTTLGLNSTTGFPTVGLVLIDNEVIEYTGVSGNNLTGCTRAFDGTSAATHSSGATVSFAFCAAHYNNAANEIIAVETFLNTVLGKATTVTAAEFARLSGVTSAIQTQLDAKAPAASPTFSGTITTPLTASRAVTVDASSRLAVSTCTAAELDFVHGVTSAIQTQLNATVANPLTADLAAGSHKITGLAAGTAAGNSVRFEQLYYGFQAPLQATSTTTFSGTSNTYSTTNLSQAITLTASAHRVKISVAGLLSCAAVQTSNVSWSIFRDSTNILDSTNGAGTLSGSTGMSGAFRWAVSGVFIDTPGSVGPFTYSVKIRNTDNATSVSFGVNGTQMMTLEEIV